MNHPTAPDLPRATTATTREAPPPDVTAGRVPFLSLSFSVVRVATVLVLVAWLACVGALIVIRRTAAGLVSQVGVLEARTARLVALGPPPARSATGSGGAGGGGGGGAAATDPAALAARAARLSARLERAALEVGELERFADEDARKVRASRSARVAALTRAVAEAHAAAAGPRPAPGTEEFDQQLAARLHERRVADLKAQIERDFPKELERLAKLLELAPEQQEKLKAAMRGHFDAMAGVAARFLDGEFGAMDDMERAAAKVRADLDQDVEAGLTPAQVLKYRQDERGSWFFRRPKPAEEK